MGSKPKSGIYFKSYQSTTDSKFTQYDLEQFDHAYKNVQTINRLLHTDVPPELIENFKLTRKLVLVHLLLIIFSLLFYFLGFFYYLLQKIYLFTISRPL